ncbi:hypothetical protein [Paenibacillus sp. HB172176]|uniref:hypothetical protein n=1 Tax=Paenibacillus sp. HB172176 TaxID=2493690 RepID=UPI00143AB601|nr:hypothetical protein [Paenibacillus sp. HB172176]
MSLLPARYQRHEPGCLFIAKRAAAADDEPSSALALIVSAAAPGSGPTEVFCKLAIHS